MPLAGSAFLALWNDIRRARESEYDRWHTLEHVPERVAVPGIRGARRYVNRARELHRYFTLYEADGLAAFESPEYADLLRNPTPWSAAMRPDFAHFLRVPCSVARSEGVGIGAAVAVLCYETTAARTQGEGPAFDGLLALAGIVGCHCGATNAAHAAADWSSGDQADATPRAFDRIMLVEALDRTAAARALRTAQAALDMAGLPADFGADVYDLAFVFPGNDASIRRRFRRPGRA